MLIGAHVSVAGGYRNGLDYAGVVGAECIQIFAKSPRQWQGPAIDADASAAFVQQRENLGFGPVFTHTAYLLNLSTIDATMHERTVIALADELVRASLLGADGVVTHVGNDPAGDPSAAALRTAATIRAAYDLAGERAARTRLLLENTAGGGTTFGCTFDELGRAITATGRPPELLGVCFDTCHAFAYGMPLDTAEGWAEVIGEIDAVIGLERLGLIHANDCLFERGSRRDRHAWIGDGFIGTKGFSAMVCAPELAHVPAVMEMPGEKPEKDVINIERFRALRDACAPSH
jgi:deoxyribonuclease-4